MSDPQPSVDGNDATPEEPKTNWISVAVGGGVVALIGGLFPLLTSFFSEDIERCRIASEFLANFDKHTMYSDDELNVLKSVYIEAAQRNCLGE